MFEWKQKQNLCWSAPYDKERASVNSENKYDYWSISEENQLLFVFMHRCRPSRWWEASTHRKFVQNSYNICVFKTWHDAGRAICLCIPYKKSTSSFIHIMALCLLQVPIFVINDQCIYSLKPYIKLKRNSPVLVSEQYSIYRYLHILTFTFWQNIVLGLARNLRKQIRLFPIDWFCFPG